MYDKNAKVLVKVYEQLEKLYRTELNSEQEEMVAQMLGYILIETDVVDDKFTTVSS